jgi:DNA-binding PadR family transcriptional regulator
MSPVFGHGHLRLYLLSLLAQSPRHGYELIQGLSDRFGGTYVPSAGTIYPRLAKLEEDGLVTKTTDGRKTVYEITDAGRAELASRLGELDGIENELSDSVRRLADEVRTSVTDAMRTLRADLASAGMRGGAESDPGSGLADGEGDGAGAGAGAGAGSGVGAGSGFGSDSGPDAAHRTPSSKSARVESRVQLQRAEILLAEFRQQVRTDLRRQVTAHTLDAAAIDSLHAQLDAVREDLRATLASLRD